MAFRNRILPHHEQEANHLLHLLNYTVKKQVSSLQVKDREDYMKWLAKGTVVRKQLLDLFKRKKEHDNFIQLRKDMKANSLFKTEK
ncbi:hypothetical protein COM11_25245 [Bacillus pseudomycoides]|uniref:hypothetical protein n=1 Tax=Bacillus pseudomycoides TaxID=64104 RepID=UPI000BF8FC7F|nr:hypothetical protein [Bacillus pseudomycoides]MED4653066.1 hypothetical protein [Bacillus pseudomycoides]PGC23530.1 hypothetical protein COM11_25245 [Bacillus pseudomycoides]